MWTYHQYQRLTAPHHTYVCVCMYTYEWHRYCRDIYTKLVKTTVCPNCETLLLWHRGVSSVYACAKHTANSSIPVLFTVNAYSRTIEAALNICKYKPAAACYAVSHAANFPRPNLGLPRGFSCYWRDAQPSCRLHASHTSADSTYDNHLFHVRHKA